ncbi:MAG: indole-3-glycerol phosphate synthase TrpC [Blastocatellia bacterium]
MASAVEHRPAGLLKAGGILDRIVEAKATRLHQAMSAVSLDELIRTSEGVERAAGAFAENLKRAGTVNVIAEIKRRSPSRGIIREEFEPAQIARSYSEAGATAMSVLCEEDYFDGSLDHLRAVRDVTATPLLRKDFLFDEYQLYEARAAGADAVLLIVAILDDSLLSRLLDKAATLNLDALVEVHTCEEMRRAAGAGATIIGVNNRDLASFKVDLRTSLDLAPLAPPRSILVSESGIATGEDIRRLRKAGYSAFLIGESFMRAADPGQALRELIREAEGESS